MRIETQKVENELRDTRQLVAKLEIELNNLNHVIREADTQRVRDQKEIEQVNRIIVTINVVSETNLVDRCTSRMF